MLQLRSIQFHPYKMYSCPFDPDARPRPLKRRRYRSSSSSDDSSRSSSVLEFSDSPNFKFSKARLEDGSFKCLKCSHTCMTETDFYDHVKNAHVWSNEEIIKLTERGSYEKDFWCPECSSVFVTKSALSMHLKGTHDFITDTSLYLLKVGYDGEIPLLKNQCDTCYSVFESSFYLEKHIRTHGLAFLRRLRDPLLPRNNADL